MYPDDTARSGHERLARAARAGRSQRLERGRPPADPADMAAWLLPAYGILVDHFERTRRRIAGAWKALPGRGGLAGIILVQAELAHPRWTLAHEWGHYATGSTAGYSLVQGGLHADMPEERDADAAAAAWLMPADELCRMVLEDWRRADIAAHYGVPEGAVLLRRCLMPALDEHWPLLDAALERLRPPDPWDPA